MSMPFSWYWHEWRVRKHDRGPFRMPITGMFLLFAGVFLVALFFDTRIQVHGPEKAIYTGFSYHGGRVNSGFHLETTGGEYIFGEIPDALREDLDIGRLTENAELMVSWYPWFLGKTVVGLASSNREYRAFRTTEEVRAAGIRSSLRGVLICLGLALLCRIVAFWWYFFRNERKLLRQDRRSKRYLKRKNR